MSLQELWRLFPILLCEHDPCWKEWYESEKKRILRFMKGQPCTLSHIGSTAIPNIFAKPTVDILMQVPAGSCLEKIGGIIQKNGYLCMSEEENRKSFNRGYTEEGYAKKVFHLHLRYENDCDEIYFRDYLLEHADVAKEYEALKISLWKRYEFDRDAYTEAKTEFIQKYTALAKEERGGKKSTPSEKKER